MATSGDDNATATAAIGSSGRGGEGGHAAHIRSAEVRGLPGEMHRPIRVTMLGAGSMFTPELARDLLAVPGNLGGTIALVDIDAARLGAMRELLERQIRALGAEGTWNVVADTDRRAVLAGTDYLINCIEVSGVECVRHDNDIPARYGVDQCIGDTAGPGGLFKALRTIPVWLEVLADAERLCPGALVLNYTNPMSMMCLAAHRTSPMRVVGLCHSVQGTSRLLAHRSGIRYRDLAWECAGINHLSWFTRLEHEGRDLYPVLMEKATRDLDGDPADPNDPADLVRKDMMLHFGAFITESSGHLSEYVPYYRKRPDLIERYCRSGYDGGSSFYADNWPRWRSEADRRRDEMARSGTALDAKRSWEYASWIIESCEKSSPYRIHGNVPNTGGLIENLPHDGIVEVACLVDHNGVSPTRYGRLPPQMSAVCAAAMAMYDLGAQAAIERSIDLAVLALLVDPLTSAVCSPAEIKAMTLDLFEAEAAFLPGFA